MTDAAQAVRARIVACVSLDCARKQRVHYRLPGPIAEGFLTRFAPDEVTVNRFSRIARGARDHFAIAQAGVLAAGGVLGQAQVTVTYGKLGRRDEPTARRAFERVLGEYFGCPIETLAASPSDVQITTGARPAHCRVSADPHRPGRS